MSDEQDKNPEIRIPENKDSAVRMVEEGMEDEESDEQKRNLIRTQYRLIE
ncbi:hypothetical protein [Halovenus halobia]